MGVPRHKRPAGARRGPAGRFGGGPTDYQLLEDEGDDGLPGITLLVHPAVGPLNADAVVDASSALGQDRPSAP
jgi:hypothetical protein